jgi:hypothetical protein
MANDDHDDGYEVGYGRPPVRTRFQPGQSGNPRGRPKQAAAREADLADLVRKFLDQSIDVVQGGRSKRIPAKEVAARQLVARLAKGDLKAFDLLDKLLGRSRGRADDQIRLEHVGELPEEDEAVIARYLRRRGDTPGDADDEGGTLQ